MGTSESSTILLKTKWTRGKIRSRIVNQRIYPGQTVDVPNATKQTTLLDFFKKPRESVRQDSLLYEQRAEGNHTPENLEKGCPQIRLNEDQSGYFEMLQDCEMDAEPPTKHMRKSKYPKPTIISLIDTSASHQQDENTLPRGKIMKHGNHKHNSVSGITDRQQSATNNDSNVPTSRSGITKPSTFETLPQSSFVSNEKSVYDYSSTLDSSYLSPSPGLSQGTDSQSCSVTFLPTKRVKNVTSSLEDIETEEVFSLAPRKSSGPCDRANNSISDEESSPPAVKKSKKLQYINPYLLDTERSHTQLTEDLGASNMLTDACTYSRLNGKVLRVNIVDSELMLNSCSIGESTERSQWSVPKLSVDDPTLSMDSPSESLVGPSLAADDPTLSVEDPTLFMDQHLVEYPCLSIIDSPSSMPRCDPSHSLADFSEFTLNTQGCFVLKEPAHGTSLLEEDSQEYD